MVINLSWLKPNPLRRLVILMALAEGDVDYKGSALCERLSSSCDDAYYKVVPSNTYITYPEYVYALMRMDDLTFD